MSLANGRTLIAAYLKRKKTGGSSTSQPSARDVYEWEMPQLRRGNTQYQVTLNFAVCKQEVWVLLTVFMVLWMELGAREPD